MIQLSSTVVSHLHSANCCTQSLQPGEQHELVNSLECGLKIEPVSDAVLYYASEAIRALPDGQWDHVFSLLDQGGSFR